MADHAGGPTAGEAPDYGPGGYLPERAARRARKIVLRREMGLQWPVAAAVAAVVVGVLGLIYLLTRTGPPGAPFEAVAALERIPPRSVAEFVVDGAPVLIVRGAAGVQAFAAPDTPVAWCPTSRRLEARDGRVWAPNGQLVGGPASPDGGTRGASLPPLRLQVYDGTVFVDPEPAVAVPAAPERRERPRCG